MNIAKPKQFCKSKIENLSTLYFILQYQEQLFTWVIKISDPNTYEISKDNKYEFIYKHCLLSGIPINIFHMKKSY